jgi:hypothetical protein
MAKEKDNNANALLEAKPSASIESDLSMNLLEKDLVEEIELENMKPEK